MLEKIFDPESRIWQVMGRVGDLIILNIIFMLTSIPIVTIGTSISALDHVEFKMMDKRAEHPVKEYFHAWKTNFSRTILIWLSYLALLALCALNINALDKSGLTERPVILILLGAVLIVATMTVVYSLAMQARFHNSFSDTLVKGFMMALAGWKYTIVMILMIIAVLMTTFRTYQMILITFPMWFLIGFSGIAYLCNIMIYHVFAKVTDKSDLEDPALEDEMFELKYDEEDTDKTPLNL